MEKLDLKSAMKLLYAPTVRQGIHVVDVPALQFLMIDGEGDPNAEAYRVAVGALYAVAYPVKFASKVMGRDYVVPPLEALWDADDISAYARGERTAWRWTAMLMVPDWISAEMVAAAVGKAAAKGVARAGEVRSERYHEGRAMQALHVGPYAEEAPLIAAMHAEIARLGSHETGRHHEIYLSDPRKVAAEKMKTIIRQPMA